LLPSSLFYSTPSSVNTVPFFPSPLSSSKDLWIYLFLNAFSVEAPSLVLPRTAVTLCPLRILETPIITATEGTAVICTTGMSTLSISWAIVAPQRLLEPQVEVRITASTPSSESFLAIPSPMTWHFLATVALPEVHKYNG